MKSAPKILIVTDDAGESFEALYAQLRFREAGYHPVIAASRKKILHGIIYDFDPEWGTYVEKPSHLMKADIAFGAVKPEEYTAVLLVGGRAPDHLRGDPKLIKIVQEFHQSGKWILCIGHGIRILLAAGIGKGLKLTCFHDGRLDVEDHGGIWSDQPSVVDGKVISARTWDCHAEFYRDIFQQFKT
jgi:protease I